MKTLIYSFLIILSLSITYGQNSQNDEISGITGCAMDYMEGALSGDAERIARALHPDFNKVYPFIYPATQKTTLVYATYSGLVEYTRSNGMFVEPNERNIKVKILDIEKELATVLVTSVKFYDYLLMEKVESEWKILNVLWVPNKIADSNSGNDIELEEAAIEKTARNYAEGYFTGDANRMTQAIHPEIYKSTSNIIEKTGKKAFRNMGSSLLIEAAAGGRGKIPESEWKITFEVLDIFNNIASAKIFTSQFNDYLHLVKIGGEWKIVNVLWQSGPEYKRN
ncbi:MAG: nuclear transport factor 2 family protein [Bacteroidetes bacterium]|nr:nuclear transport factor 2 family protein [Bacteroidota bacterium]